MKKIIMLTAFAAFCFSASANSHAESPISNDLLASLLKTIENKAVKPTENIITNELPPDFTRCLPIGDKVYCGIGSTPLIAFYTAACGFSTIACDEADRLSRN